MRNDKDIVLEKITVYVICHFFLVIGNSFWKLFRGCIWILWNGELSGRREEEKSSCWKKKGEWASRWNRFFVARVLWCKTGLILFWFRCASYLFFNFWVPVLFLINLVVLLFICLFLHLFYLLFDSVFQLRCSARVHDAEYS